MTIKKFAGIVDGDIFTIVTIDSEFQGTDGAAGDRIIAGFLSEPKFVEIPEGFDIGLNWTWNENEFVPPVN
jgi:hypothetical protein